MERTRFPRRLLAVRPLACASGAFAAGTALGALCPGLPLVPLLGVLALSLVLFAILRRRGEAALCAGLFCLGAVLAVRAQQVPPLPEKRGAQIEGVVASDVDTMDGYIRMELKDVTVDGEALPCGVMFSIYGEADPADYPLDSRIAATGRTYRATEQKNPHAFSYRQYLWRRGVGLCAYAGEGKVEVTPPQGRISLGGFMQKLRLRLREAVSQIYPAPYDALVKALVLGYRRDMGEEETALFQGSGIAHLLALSGLHIAVLALFLTRLLGLFRVKRSVRLLLMLCLLVFYAALVGARASVIRAGLFFMMVELGQMTGRPRDGLTALLFALAAILACTGPLAILDSGLILSFSAVAGILCLNRALTPRFVRECRITENGPVRRRLSLLLRRDAPELLIVSASAQLGSLPASAGMFHVVYPLSLAANLAAVPLVTAALPVAFLSVALSPVLPWAAKALSLPVQGALWLVLQVARWVCAVPFSAVRMGTWHPALIVAWLVCGLTASPYLTDRRWLRRTALALLPVLIGLSLLLPHLAHNRGLEVHFMDVGDADCAVVFAEGEVCLIDAGQYDDGADYLDALGRSPGTVFLTHPHTDHALGFEAILERFPAGRLYLPCTYFTAEDPGPGLLELIDRARALGWTVEELCAGDEVPLSEHVLARVLQPEAGDAGGANETCLVMEVTCAGRSVLFTGDLPESAERAAFPDCDVLKVAHHGSKTSTSAAFLAQSRPEIAVISGDGDGTHPAPEVLERLNGAQIYRTDRHGMITLRISPEGAMDITAFVEEAP